MLIANLTQEGSFCPSFWTFLTDGGRSAYVRYRWGYLSLRVEEAGADVEIYGEQLGHSYHGVIDWEDVLPKIEGIDIEEAIYRAFGLAWEHSERFKSDPGYRRSCWLERIQETMKYITDSAEYNRRMKESGSPLVGDFQLSVWDEERIEEELKSLERMWLKEVHED